MKNIKLCPLITNKPPTNCQPKLHNSLFFFYNLSSNCKPKANKFWALRWSGQLYIVIVTSKPEEHGFSGQTIIVLYSRHFPLIFCDKQFNAHIKYHGKKHDSVGWIR